MTVENQGQTEAEAGWLAQGFLNCRLGCRVKPIKNFIALVEVVGMLSRK